MSMNADNVDDGNMYLNFSYKRKHYFWELFYFIPFYSLKGVQIDITSSFFISSFYFLLKRDYFTINNDMWEEHILYSSTYIYKLLLSTKNENRQILNVWEQGKNRKFNKKFSARKKNGNKLLINEIFNKLLL